jgi:hypothetical protein
MNGLRTRLAGLLMFAAAMGWLEAVVVVYLRAIVGIGYGESMPEGDIVLARIRAYGWLLPIEQGRELATMVMLAMVAWLGADRLRSRFGAWLMIFGVWDIVYYVGLRTMIAWPKSLAAMDLLFLIPSHPLWYQPIWLPILMSCLMIGAGLWLQRPARV